MYVFLLVLFSTFVPKMHRFWHIRFQICRHLEHRVRGLSRSLEMSPCGRAHMTSCWRSIVTMALSRVVSEIFNVEKCRDLWCQRSLKVIENYTIQSGPHEFLLTFHSNHRPISHRLRDKEWYPSKIANFPTPVYLMPPMKGFALEFGIIVRGPKCLNDEATRWSNKF